MCCDMLCYKVKTIIVCMFSFSWLFWLYMSLAGQERDDASNDDGDVVFFIVMEETDRPDDAGRVRDNNTLLI